MHYRAAREGEVVRGDGGVEVECLTDEEDGVVHLKVEGWVVG